MTNFITENPVFKTLTTSNTLINKFRYKEPGTIQMAFNALISTLALSIFAVAGFASAALGIAFVTGATISTTFTLGNTIGAISGLTFGFLALTPPANKASVKQDTELKTSPANKAPVKQDTELEAPKGKKTSPANEASVKQETKFVNSILPAIFKTRRDSLKPESPPSKSQSNSPWDSH